MLGFYNPIPECMFEHRAPVLYIEYAVPGDSHSMWWEDNEEVRIEA